MQLGNLLLHIRTTTPQVSCESARCNLASVIHYALIPTQDRAYCAVEPSLVLRSAILLVVVSYT